ncbi:MAG: MFS transporter [Lentisphaeria bacterium]|jgi:MFS family permease|nr:MFS transporter [Lentisphaeria bacterium]
MLKPDTTGKRLGPLWIRPGLTRMNALTVVFGSFSSVAMIVFMSLMQPFVLTEIVHVPASEQGTITGFLHLLQEIVTIALVGLMGAWSDRVGRRIVYSLGFIILGLGYFVYPLASSTVDLAIFRLVFAVGAAMVPVMLSVTIQDTPQEISRGKWVGFNNIFQGLGVVLLSTVFLKNAPQYFTGLGYDAATAGRLTFWCATGMCLLFAMVLWSGIERSIKGRSGKTSLLTQAVAGIAEARRNPRLALAFGAAFIGRGDLVIVGSFLTLWITQAGIEQGLSTAKAVGQAGMMFGIVQLAAMGSAFFVGIIADRIDRVTGLCIALATACIGYTLMGAMAEPFDSSMIPFALLLGVGEVSVIVAAAALLGQEAGTEKRGAVVGAFNLMGGIGIMSAGMVGGLIFDGVGRSAPFVAMGLLNGVLLLIGLFVKQRGGSPETEI